VLGAGPGSRLASLVDEVAAEVVPESWTGTFSRWWCSLKIDISDV
jgi:hypothetical protein